MTENTVPSNDTTLFPENEEHQFIVELKRSTVYWFVAEFSDTCLIFEVLLIIFFCCQFYKRKQDWSSVYYILLTVGYIISFIFQFFYLFDDSFRNFCGIFKKCAFAFEWYFLFFNGFWNLSIAAFRSTAIGFPIQHKQIWKNKQIPAVLIVLIFPFLVNGYTLFDPYYKIHMYDPECFDKTISTVTDIAFYLNIVLTFATFFIIIASYIRSKAISNSKYFSNNVERRLIIQAILSTVCQLIFYLFYVFNPGALLFDEDSTLIVLLIFFMIQHYVNVVVLFVVSKNFRHDILSFCHLNFLAKFEIYSQTNSGVLFVTK